MTRNVPRPPDGLKASGRALWRSLVADFDLDDHEMSVLLEACRTKDSISELQIVLDQEGVIVETPQGKRAHPALVELRQQRITLMRLLGGLRLPVTDEFGVERPAQRRGGPRKPNLRQVQ